MIRFKDKTFNNYIEFLNFLILENIEPKGKWFPGSSHFYLKAHLEEKFQQKFTHREIRSLLAYAKDHQKFIVQEVTANASS